MRSVGVVLMSAMLVAPAAAARQYTNKFSRMFPIAALFGTLSGFLGNYFSSEISRYLNWKNPAAPLGLPTGPMIVMIASLLCLLSLLFAPEKGMILRFFRLARFRYKCLCENLLKAIWRFGGKEPVTFELIEKYQTISPLYLRFILWRLTKNGWIEKILPDSYRLTLDGKVWANKIVRLHRLWEVYLVEYLGLGVERVHRSAEEMEHIITPELEKELTLLLKDPKVDPHHQPIPPREK
jgi:manganese/zinc/iron transport system permease protein